MDPLIKDPFGGHDRSVIDRAGGPRRVADLPGENVVVVLARPVSAAGLVLQIVTQNWCGCSHRPVGIDERRQLFVFDLDHIDRVGSDVAILGDDEGYFLALKQHLLVGQYGLNIAGEGWHPVQLQRFQVFSGQHRLDAGQCERSVFFDRFDAGMAIRRADEITKQHARQFEVVDVVALALRKADILDALAPGTEAFEPLRPRLGGLGLGRHSAASLAPICSAAARIALTIVR